MDEGTEESKRAIEHGILAWQLQSEQAASDRREGEREREEAQTDRGQREGE